MFFSFIDHSFEEHRKFYERNSAKEVLPILNWYSIHLLIRNFKRPDILLELAYVWNIRSWINAVEVLLLEVPFYKL